VDDLNIQAKQYERNCLRIIYPMTT